MTITVNADGTIDDIEEVAAQLAANDGVMRGFAGLFAAFEEINADETMCDTREKIAA